MSANAATFGFAGWSEDWLAGHHNWSNAGWTYSTVESQNSLTSLAPRPVDGFGVNAINPEWGSTGANLLRLAADDRGPNGEMSGADRPNAREISNAVARGDADTPNTAGASDFLWIWGQFLDHDLSLTEAGDTISAPIAVPVGDPMFDPMGTGQAFIPFNRVDEHDGGYANEITAYIDASMIYGSDAETVEKMRVEGGKLVMTEDAQLELEGVNLVTGDVRAAENIALSSMHTIFTREHNRIVDELLAIDPTLSDDQVFDAARARVEAIVQAVTFKEFLPILVGDDAFGAYAGYDEMVNVGISVEFSTAVYRLGHTLLSSNLQRVAEDGTAHDPLALKDAFFRPSLLREDNMIEDVLRGAATQSAQAVDTVVVEDVRSFLFGPPGAGGLDLAALNIQRGRDLGVASYNDLREAVGLDRATDFSDITSDAELAAKLTSVYGDVDLVDAWIGGLAEDALPDGMLGELFSVIMIDQFTRLRDGDAYWSEGRAGLSEAERTELWDTTLADIILRNTDVEAIQTDVFAAMTRSVGTDGQDRLVGASTNDFIFGGAGHDRISGRDGNDDLQGGAGRDKLMGDAGDDILSGDAGRDKLIGGLGDDTLSGGEGRDKLKGGQGNDTLNGDEGRDYISGGRGDDVMTGGAGRDMFVFRADHLGHDVITDFEIGRDQLSLRGSDWWGVDISADGSDLVLRLNDTATITLEGLHDDVGMIHWWALA